MQISHAIEFCLDYHKTNSKKNSVKTYQFILTRFNESVWKREIDSVPAGFPA